MTAFVRTDDNSQPRTRAAFRTRTVLSRSQASLESRPDLLYWLLQLVGWSAFCVVTFVSLTLWYNQIQLVYVEHTLVQALLGVLLTSIIRPVFRIIWNEPLWQRVALTGMTVAVASAAWTVLRIQAFIWLTGEEGIWIDFGGWYFGSFMLFASWSLAYYGMKFYLLFQEEQETTRLARAYADAERVKRLTAETLARDAQLKMLRYQLNPHFLFNTLNSISALIRTDRTRDARDMIEGLSRFLRYSLDNDPALKVALNEELFALGLYLDIERKRFGDRLTVTVDVDPGVADAKIPSLLLQPIIENSLKFAIAKTTQPGEIRIQASNEGSSLRLEMSDSGAADAGTVARDGHRGIGLSNIRRRLTAEYGERYQLNSEPDGDGWKTIIVLPLETGDRHSFRQRTARDAI